MDDVIPRSRLTVILTLSVLALLLGLALYCTQQLTADQIEVNARTAQLRVIDPVMPLQYDNLLYGDTIDITEPGYFGNGYTVSVFRARLHDEPVGIVFMPVHARGYNGDIELVIGIAYDGTLLGVRTLRHRETPGLGDGIDQDNSGWINGFTGLSLDSPPQEAWVVRADGGMIDHISGATISSRGVVNAVRKTLEYYRLQRDQLYLQ